MIHYNWKETDSTGTSHDGTSVQICSVFNSVYVCVDEHVFVLVVNKLCVLYCRKSLAFSLRKLGVI